jgi:probable phosphoglycerate mutase
MRHGQSLDNANKLVSGNRETPLTQIGKHQAKLVASKTKKLSIDRIVCSPLGRAKETARIIADALDYPDSSILTLDELRERDLGDLEGFSYAKNERLNGNFPAVEHIRGVEPLDRLHARVQHALRLIMQDKKHHNVLIVCHFIVGRMLRVVAEGKKPESIYEEPRIENATIYQLT